MPTKATQADLLHVLRERQELRPSQILEAMRLRGYSQDEAREAVSYLIRDHQIEFTPDRILRPITVEAR
jgi:hypothetical protein